MQIKSTSLKLKVRDLGFKIWYQYSLHDSNWIYVNIFQMPRSLMTPETKLGNSIF